METQTITNFFQQYGPIAIFVIVFLEYLNLPGFPAGVVMPLAGIWAAKGELGLINALLITIVAGLCGSWILYFLGRLGGDIIINKYIKKFPKHEVVIQRSIEKIENWGYMGVFFAKLIPMVRTVISIPAGVLKMNFLGYTLSSGMGIAVWNLVFVGAGYWFGESVLQILA